MRLLALLAALLFASPAAAQSAAAGTAGAQFLKLGAGARATAMGGACAASCDDAYSLYWNPAGLSRITSGGEADFFHGQPYGLLDYDYAAVAASVKSWDSVLAAGITRLGTSQQGYNASNRPTGGFTTQDLALSLGIASRFEMRPDRTYEDERFLRAGAAIKLISQSAPGEQISGLAADLGLQGAAFEDADNAVRLGFSVLNLGPGLGPAGARSPLPASANLGVAYTRWPSHLILTAELTRPVDGDVDLRLGLEWRPITYIAFRAGFSSMNSAGSVLDSLSLGGGLLFKSLEFGVSFVGQADLGRTLLFDLKWRW